MRYLAAFAYQRASQLTFSEDAEDAYRRKAVFAMEGNLVRNPFFYNKIRYADMEIAFLKEQEVAVALEERILEDEKKWASEGKDMEKAFLGAYADRIPSFLSAGEIDLWPENPGVAFEFTSKEVENERSRTSYTPNDEITNPSLDISAVKKDYRFNLYALIVFAFLFGALGIIWYKFRKMEKLQREKEELEQ